MGKKKKSGKTIFESIRKPIAPPTQKIGENKPNERANPAGRKQKHKKHEESDETNQKEFA